MNYKLLKYIRYVIRVLLDWWLVRYIICLTMIWVVYKQNAQNFITSRDISYLLTMITMIIAATVFTRYLRLPEKRNISHYSFTHKIITISYFHLFAYPFLTTAFSAVVPALLYKHGFFSASFFEVILILLLLLMPVVTIFAIKKYSKKYDEESYLKLVKTAIEANEYVYWVLLTISGIFFLQSTATAKAIFTLVSFPLLAKSRAVKFYTGYRLSKIDEINKTSKKDQGN